MPWIGNAIFRKSNLCPAIGCRQKEGDYKTAFAEELGFSHYSKNFLIR